MSRVATGLSFMSQIGQVFPPASTLAIGKGQFSRTRMTGLPDFSRRITPVCTEQGCTRAAPQSALDAIVQPAVSTLFPPRVSQSYGGGEVRRKTV